MTNMDLKHILMGIALILFSIPMFLIFFWLGAILAVFGLIVTCIGYFSGGGDHHTGAPDQ